MQEKSKTPFFHEGEIACQAEAGVDTATYEQRIDEYLSLTINPNDIEFVSKRTFSIAATMDASGRPWLSPLFGVEDKLFRVNGPTTVLIDADVIAGDPLRDNITDTGQLSVLFLNLARRRRAKSLGTAVIEEDCSITYKINRYFSLCPKYIFRRDHQPATQSDYTPPEKPARSEYLKPDHTVQLEAADMVFLGSYHTDHGVDATLRGGPAGFVKVVDNQTLSIPDYLGNGMYNTLGNLRLDDHLALLSIDFKTGRTLHITGRATVGEAASDDELAVRSLLLHIEEVRQSWPDAGTWDDIEAFPHAPGLVNPVTPMLK